MYARYHIRATYAALDRQDYLKAWDHVEKALNGRPGSADLHLLAARVARQNDRMEEARLHFERCYELQHGISEPLQIERMMLAAQTGRAETVLEPLYDYVRKDHPLSPLILEALCMGFRQLRSGNVAAYFANQWLQREPDNVQALICRGVCFGEMGNFPEAAKDFEKACRISPDHPGCRLNLGIARLQLAQFKSAATLFEQALAIEPDNGTALLGLAQCKIAMNEQEQAQSILDGLIERDQETPEILVERGKVALQLGQPEVAEKWTRRAYQTMPSYHPAVYQLELCLRTLGITKEADDLGQQRLQLEADMHQLQELITGVLARPGPHPPKTYHEIGALFLKRGETNQGLYYLYKALEGDPSLKQTHSLLVQHYEKVGDNERAKTHREILEVMGPRAGRP